ncbi:hypothetical protein [Shewanella sp. 4_MG-2023]|uniref:hypothetical protein n=1 Tax=Shewanella sp. 4_MG-2023 TaxID=3062652 RepID=UPI0026E1358F|nr:hypothetical protein [Shewanella sp. 4_MG-2023]MDO6679512.1 hypothetical protein [Shewanella sp. 4_MG-2023]
MASWELAKYLAGELVKEHNLKNAESWLTEEVLYLLNKYPELESYIDSKSGTLTISDIISAYLLSPRNNKKTKRLYLRWFKPETLYKLRLSHYLLAGFLFSTALRFCFNHRYNKQQLILWEIDYTESKKLILKNLAIHKMVVSVEKGKGTTGYKNKRR